MKNGFWLLALAAFINAFAITSGSIDLSLLESNEIALLQFDSRPLANYWLTSAKWNNYYCNLHGHVFIYMTTAEECRHETEPLASPWCKVKAMLQANRDFPQIRLFIYMDSDAVINKKYELTPINEMLRIMQDNLDWDPLLKPIVFNQDGPCWWCSLIQRVGYTRCLNAGTVVWYRHEYSEMILQEWWDASMDPYEGNPIKRRFRIKWPWEQDRQMAVYNRSATHIQIAPQPEQVMMNTHEGHGGRTWCLSHIPSANCFIAHYCEHKTSKNRLNTIYSVPSSPDLGSQVDKQRDRIPQSIEISEHGFSVYNLDLS